MENYYQGDKITVTLDGGTACTLNSTDFGVCIFPKWDASSSIKSALTAVSGETNVFTATFKSADTKKLAAGIYALEVYDDNQDVIYHQDNAFVMNVSASKTYMTES